MKYLIASDIHGSAPELQCLMERFGEERADILVLLGDLLYHGPRNDLPEGYSPKQCIEILNNFTGTVLSVRGNCDAEVDQMVLNFPILAEYAILEHCGRLIYLSHGHRELPPLKNGAVALCGHTHVLECEDRGTYTYINPGSISLPKEGSPKSYIILENGVFTAKKLENGAVVSIMHTFGGE